MSFKTRRIREERPVRVPWHVPGKAASSVLSFLSSLFRRTPAQGKTKPGKASRETPPERVALLKRATVILFSVLLVFILLAGVVQALASLKILSIRSLLNTAGTALQTDANGYTNYLLLGKGDDDHDGVDLTDTIMIASVDPKTESVVLLSIPRDLYVLQSEKMGKGRINELYRDYKASLRRTQKLDATAASQEAMRELMKEISSKIDLPIHYAAMVNFSGFESAVDALGGIDINVPYDIVDTEYPGPNYTYDTFEIHAGPTHMDGKTALKYARSRHTTSDFGRSARQQQVIQAAGERAKSLGLIRSPGKLLSLYRIMTKNVETTMTTGEMISTAKLGEAIDRSRIISMQLSDRNGLYGSGAEPGGFLYSPPREEFEGASVLLPVSIPELPVTWKQIRSFVHLLTQNRPLYLQAPQIIILNATGKTGLAGKIGTELSRYGFNVAKTKNASVKQDTSFILGLAEQDRASADFFATLLKLPFSTSSHGLTAEEQGQVTIVIGKDFAYKPLQDLLPAPK